MKSKALEKLLLVTVCPPDLTVSISFAKTLRIIQLPPGSDFMMVSGLPWGAARNQAAKEALDNKYHLAFLDADIRVLSDSYIKLLGTGLDIVSGLYYQKSLPYMPVMFNDGQDDQGNSIMVPVIDWAPGDIVPCALIPSGLTVYRLQLLAKIFEHFPRPFEWGIDVAPVPTEKGQLPPSSEDFTFSLRAKSLGFQPFVNTGVVGLHEVRAVVGPKWVVGLPSSNPLYGICGGD